MQCLLLLSVRDFPLDDQFSLSAFSGQASGWSHPFRFLPCSSSKIQQHSTLRVDQSSHWCTRAYLYRECCKSRTDILLMIDGPREQETQGLLLTHIG